MTLYTTACTYHLSLTNAQKDLLINIHKSHLFLSGYEKVWWRRKAKAKMQATAVFEIIKSKQSKLFMESKRLQYGFVYKIIIIIIIDIVDYWNC